MKTPYMLVTIALLGAVTAQSQTPVRLACGLEFQAPAGWHVQSNGTAAVMLPPGAVRDQKGQPVEIYLVTLLAGVKDIDDPRLAAVLEGKTFPAGTTVREVSAPRRFRAGGLLHSYDFVSGGERGRLDIYALGLAGGGTGALIAAGRPELVERRRAEAAVVASSMMEREASAGAGQAGALARFWDERLRGRKLMQFSSYAGSGNSGGYSSQKSLVLGEDGVYVFHRSSSVSVYVPGATGGSAGQSGATGRWRVYEQAGQAMLELVDSRGTPEVIALSTSAEGKTFLNGARWFIAGPGQ